MKSLCRVRCAFFVFAVQSNAKAAIQRIDHSDHSLKGCNHPFHRPVLPNIAISSNLAAVDSR